MQRGLLYHPRTQGTLSRFKYCRRYGLGQTYELLNLHNYALYYYKKAMTQRPADARMWVALAGCFENMDRKAEALRCFEKAYQAGDSEGMALPRLAKLYSNCQLIVRHTSVALWH